MASAGNLVINIRGDASNARLAFQDATKASEQFSGHVGHIGAGGARSFKFLGKEIKEAGESLGGANSQLGEMLGGLGGVTQGVGEAVHGYHALHSAIGLATAAQTILNSITPAGWLLIAAGAISAAYAYITFGKHVETAAEKSKRLKEALSDIHSKSGVGFDRESAEHLKELKKHLEEAIAVKPNNIAGLFTRAAEINKATESISTLTEAIKKNKQELSSDEADNALNHILKTAHELNKTPLQLFIEDLKASGRSAKDAAEEIKKFKAATAEIDKDNAAKQAAKDKEEEANEYGRLRKQQREEEARHYDELAKKAKSVVEAANPLEKFKDQFNELKEILDAGLITSNQMSKSLQKDRQNILKGLESEAPIYTGATKVGDWSEIVEMMEDEKRQEWAQKQLDAQTKTLQSAQNTVSELQDIKSILSGEGTMTFTL